MKIFSVFALFAVGMSPFLISILAWTHTKCHPNPHCTEYVQKGLPKTVEKLKSLLPTGVSDALSPIKTFIIFPPAFKITLTKDICSEKINSTTRRDFIHLKVANFKHKMLLNLVSEIPQLLNLEDILKKLSSEVPCVKATPRVLNIVSQLLSKDHSIAQCIPKTLPLGANVTGYLTVVISDSLSDGDYTAHKDNRWIANKARLELSHLKFWKETCDGSPMFNKACNCLLKTDTFVKLLSVVIDAIYTCLFQLILDSDNSDKIKCPHFE